MTGSHPFFTNLLPLLLILPHAGAAGTASITLDLRENHSAIVTEHFSLPVTELVFLPSPCATIENLRVDAAPQPAPSGRGPWITLQVPNALNLSYEAVPAHSDPRTCPVPLLMPKHPLDSVSLTIQDRTRAVLDISLPQLSHPEPARWTGTLPAIPSKIQIEWRTGQVPMPSPEKSPTGLFFWNFTGLVAVLISWTILYLVWARAS